MAITSTSIKTAEENILKNIQSPVESYEVDGEKVTNKDPLKQLDAIDRLKSSGAARNPVSAIRFMRFPGSTGQR